MFPPREITPWLVIILAIAMYFYIRLDELTPKTPWRWGDAQRCSYVKPIVNVVGALLAITIVVLGSYLYRL